MCKLVCGEKRSPEYLSVIFLMLEIGTWLKGLCGLNFGELDQPVFQAFLTSFLIIVGCWRILSS